VAFEQKHGSVLLKIGLSLVFCVAWLLLCCDVDHWPSLETQKRMQAVSERAAFIWSFLATGT